MLTIARKYEATAKRAEAREIGIVVNHHPVATH
jgi:hypothetical protein